LMMLLLLLLMMLMMMMMMMTHPRRVTAAVTAPTPTTVRTQGTPTPIRAIARHPAPRRTPTRARAPTSASTHRPSVRPSVVVGIQAQIDNLRIRRVPTPIYAHGRAHHTSRTSHTTNRT
jgi:hypothetical protein